jgi:ribosomal protein S18 acetylase RimI-like enzyme
MGKIIRLDQRHADQLATIDFECEHPVDRQRNLSKEDMLKYIKKRIEKGQEMFYGYEEEDDLRGYVTLIPFFPGYKHCEVYWLAVKKQFQRHGVGRKLMCFIEDLAKEMKFRKVCLYTGKEMADAQIFYEKIGYGVVNEFSDFYGYQSGNCTAVLYAKNLFQAMGHPKLR